MIHQLPCAYFRFRRTGPFYLFDYNIRFEINVVCIFFICLLALLWSQQIFALFEAFYIVKWLKWDVPNRRSSITLFVEKLISKRLGTHKKRSDFVPTVVSFHGCLSGLILTTVKHLVEESCILKPALTFWALVK